ncbi:MAG: GerMN domain-containing protein [Lachnospiraceae bacterium]|nr:GerMN domain-containing protein [Lachnospiraceae bacterium]
MDEMSMEKRTCLVLMAFMVLAAVTGCSFSEEGREAADADHYFYHIDATGTELVKVAYMPYEETTEVMIQDFMKLLNDKEHGEDDISLLPEGVEIVTHSVHESVLNLDFNKEYLEMDAAREVLARAGVVKTFAQLPDIEYVKFQVDGKPFLDSNKKPIGIMNEESFVENSGENLNSYLTADVSLYFASENGEKLVREERKVYFDKNVTLENVVVQQLLKGPRETGKPTLPSSAKLVSVTTMDKVCYVNFSRSFLEEPLPLREELPIYSVVDSLIDTCRVEKVQLSIDGVTDVTYGEQMRLDQFYEKNEELIDKTK